LGLIEKQTIKGTIYTYLGVVIGVVTNIFLFAWFFTPQQVGLVSVVLSYAILFSQIGNLGFDNVTGRLFPWFRTEDKKHHGYTAWLMLSGLIGTGVIMALFFVLKPFILSGTENSSELLKYYVYYIPVTAVFLLFFNLFDAYSRMLYLSVRGTVLKEFIQRVLVVLTISAFILSWIDYDGFVAFYFASICFPTLIIIFMLLKEGNVSFSYEPGFISKSLRKSIFSVAGFGIISVFSGTVIVNIDRIMIEKYVGLYDAGIYTVTFFFGVVILLPSRSLQRITSTFLSEAWKKMDIQVIKDIYYKSCLNQLLFASLLFAGIWANIDNVFFLLPEKYMAGKWVIFWICTSSLIDMATGVNNAIIATSAYYKLHAVFMVIFVAIVVVTNMLMIPLYGITGAAIASTISMFIFNLMRYLFLLFKFKLQPFNYRILIILALAFATYLVGWLIPSFKPFWLDIIVRSGVMTVFFMTPVLWLNLSPEVTAKAKQVFALIKSKM
jgi:O-antigen/teichoic acid export membrane protein